MNLKLINWVDIQYVVTKKIPQRPSYDFWENRINTSSDIGILPSVGVSLEI
ncbi:hypothetical protein L0Z72_04445 [candidate division KSB1 bacterium]|nr:hypothetical protein [candidate division KSB1 bacterium]